MAVLDVEAGVTYPLRDLRAKPDEELIDEHDRVAKTGVTDVNYYLAELARRDQERQTAEMVRLTRQMRNLTIIILLLTLANVGLVLFLTLAG